MRKEVKYMSVEINSSKGLDVVRKIAAKRRSGFIISNDSLSQAEVTLGQRHSNANRRTRYDASLLQQASEHVPASLMTDVVNNGLAILVDYTGNLSLRREQ